MAAYLSQILNLCFHTFVLHLSISYVKLGSVTFCFLLVKNAVVSRKHRIRISN